MKALNKKENGALTIDAIFGLTFFILTILAIMFMALVIRVQANMQYALGQTAKEISGYYYMLDKIGLTSILSGASTDTTNEKLEKINTTINQVVNFSSDLNDVSGQYFTEDGLVGIDTLIDMEMNDEHSENFDKIVSGVNDIKASLTDIANSEPKQQLIAVLQVFGRSLVNTGFSYLVAPFVCKALLPKYLTSGDVNEYFESVGIDPDKVNYHGCQLMADGRSIKLRVTYEMDLSKLTYGMINTSVVFRQSVSTAAWIRPDGANKKTIADIAPSDD